MFGLGREGVQQANEGVRKAGRETEEIRNRRKGERMIYKRGDKYWYEFVWAGRRVRESAKTGNPKVARQVESARKTEMAKGEVGIKDKPPAPTFEEFSKRFVTWVKTEKAEKPNTIQFYKERVRQLLTFDKLKNAPLDVIDEQLIADYVQRRTSRTRHHAIRIKDGFKLADTHKPISVSSINRDLATLRRVLNVARLWKVIPSVPVIRLLPGERCHERVLTHREEELYLSGAPTLLREFATIMLDTGMRPEEICRMRWEFVRLNPIGGSHFGYLHNPSGKTKWAKRNLSLTSRVNGVINLKYEAADKAREGWVFPGGDPEGHLSYATIDSQHDRTIQKLNALGPNGEAPKNPVARFRMYDLRHTFLTRLGEANADPFSIQRIAGHASILVSQRYVHPTPERLEDAFVRLERYNIVKEEQRNAEEKKKAEAA
jgi:integrase